MVIVNTSELYPVVLDLEDTEYSSIEETAVRRTTPTSNTVQDLLYHHPLSSSSSSYVGDSNGRGITNTSNSPSSSSHKRSNSASLEYLFESSSSLSSNTNDYSNNQSSSFNEKAPANANGKTAISKNLTTPKNDPTECFDDGYVLTKEIDDNNPISTIWEAIHRQSGLRYAVKIMHKKRFVHFEEQSAQVYHEVDILKYLSTKQQQQHQVDGVTTTATTKRSHPFLKFADFYEDGHYFYIVTEYIHQGQTLTSYIRQQKQQEDEEADRSSTFLKHKDQKGKHLISSLLEAIHDLHYQYRVCHCNLNTDNILLVPSNNDDNKNTDTFDYSIILCGFGNAEYLDDKKDCNKPYRPQQRKRELPSLSAYVAPEKLKNSGTSYCAAYSKPYNHTASDNNNNNCYNHNHNGCKCDAWSVGVIMYSILNKTLSSSLSSSSSSLFDLTRTITKKNKSNQENPSTSSTATDHNVLPNNDIHKSTTNELFRRFHNRECSSNNLLGWSSTSLSFLTKDFLSGLLRVDPKIRMSPQEALLHPWLAEIREATDFPDSVSTRAKPKGLSTGTTYYDTSATTDSGTNSHHDSNVSQSKKKKKKKKKKKTRSTPSPRRRTKKRAKELVDRVAGAGGEEESASKNCNMRIACNTTSSPLLPNASSCSSIQSPQILMSHKRLSLSHQQACCRQSSKLVFSKSLPKVDEEDCHQKSALLLEGNTATTKTSFKVRTTDDGGATPGATMTPPVVSPPRSESPAERVRRFWRDPTPSMRSAFNKPSHFAKMSPSPSTPIHQDSHPALKNTLPSKECGDINESGYVSGGGGGGNKACLLATSTTNHHLRGSSNSISNKERIRRFWKVFAHPTKRADSNVDENTTGLWIQRTQSEESTKTESVLSIQG